MTVMPLGDMNCVIFDIDGTFADTRHRLHHLRKSPRDWKAFQDACIHDTIVPYVYEVYCLIKDRVPIFFCTSRPESHRPQTLSWFEERNILHPNLMMRKNDDHRKDEEIKKDMLIEIWRQGYEVLFAFEDRPSVVQMWRSNGVPCFVVNDTPWHAEIKRDAILEAAALVHTLGQSAQQQYHHSLTPDHIETELKKLAERQLKVET